MSNEEWVDMFGECFADDPTSFQFLPGERLEIRAAANIAKTIVQSLIMPQTIHTAREAKKRRMEPTDETNGRSAGKKSKKTLEGYIKNWFNNTTWQLSCSMADFTIEHDKDSVKCNLCGPLLNSIAILHDAKGNWNATRFQRHVKKYHCAASSEATRVVSLSPSPVSDDLLLLLA